MSLDDIAEIVAGPDTAHEWRKMIDHQQRRLQERIERMEAARAFLEHVASHHDTAPDGCPY